MNGLIFGFEIPEQFLAIGMVITLFAFLMSGYPVAFTLGGVALIFGLIGLDLDFFKLLPQRIWGVMGNITLIAVPLFVFMGVMLERAGIAESLLQSMSQMFGRLKSGLAVSVILSGAVLAASTGIVGASVVTMGLISLPVMLRRGYPAEFSSGVICASGTLGQIIPPSIVLILLGDIVGVSVGELFIAAIIPGIILVLSYAIYATFYCARSESLPESIHEQKPLSELLLVSLKALFPPLALIFFVLGSIFLGVASPTEAAAVGALGSIVLAACYKKLNLSVLNDVMDQTQQLTCMVFMILIGAQAFGLVFRGLSGDDAIREIVMSLNYGPTTFLIAVMLLIFILGCFLDFIEITFIVVPILVPLVAVFQFDMIWFSILVAVNLQMSFLTPPFGFSLFYLKGVAPPEVSSAQIYKGIIPFVIIQAVVLALLVVYPQLVTFLPSVIG